MIFSEYQCQAKRTMEPGGLSAVANYAMGLAGEVGEVVDLLKKHLFHGHPLNKEKLIEELGDCLWYLAALCEEHELHLGDVAARNIIKLQKRYPNGFSKEDSIARVDTQ